MLITGGDSGIGRAAAIAYAREGADVAIQFFPGEERDAEEVAEYIKKAGRKAVLLPYDLRDESKYQEIIDKTVEALGGLDTLVLNAAQQIARESPFRNCRWNRSKIRSQSTSSRCSDW